MKRFYIFVLVIALGLSMGLSGCGEQLSATETPNNSVGPTQSVTPSSSTAPIILDALPYLIYIEGQLYQLGAPVDSNVEITDSQIVGYSLAGCYDVPDENGESNFVHEGTPYAYLDTEAYPNTYVIKFKGQWCVLFLAEGN